MKRTLLALFLCCFGFMVTATPWVVDNESSEINFITTKKVNVSEVHEFKKFSGNLNDKGKFELSIELASVWTNIEIRDTRMKEVLFEVASFPRLTIKSSIPQDALAQIAVGSSELMLVDAKLSLHGKTQILPINLRVIKLSEKEILVVSTRPVIVNAEQFGLSVGVEKLRELAGLTSIGHSVPVSFILNLTR